MIAGRQVQLTLRDTDEARLLERLQAVLAPGARGLPLSRGQSLHSARPVLLGTACVRSGGPEPQHRRHA